MLQVKWRKYPSKILHAVDAKAVGVNHQEKQKEHDYICLFIATQFI